MDKIRKCYSCKTIDGPWDKYHYNRCQRCKKELNKAMAKQKIQKQYEAIYGKDETIRFCKCGDYFKNIYKNRDKCKRCRTKKVG